MRVLRPFVALSLVLYFALAPLSGVALAQESGQEQQAASVVTGAELDAAIRGRVEQDRQARESVLRVLQRAEVRQLAAGLGLDLRDAESAVTTLDSEELQSAATHAEALDEALSGGAVIHISLVAALLVIIIIILLVD